MVSTMGSLEHTMSYSLVSPNELIALVKLACLFIISEGGRRILSLTSSSMT